jgi:hypothetical protein
MKPSVHNKYFTHIDFSSNENNLASINNQCLTNILHTLIFLQTKIIKCVTNILHTEMLLLMKII